MSDLGVTGEVIPVGIPFDLSKDSALVRGIVESLEERGLVVPVRLRPYSVSELVELGGISETSVRRLIEDGTLVRCAGSGKILVTVKSVREWLGFEEGKGGWK